MQELELGAVEILIIWDRLTTLKHELQINSTGSSSVFNWCPDCSHEGCQFAKSIGGIGGLLRWPVTFTNSTPEGDE